jgi:beta-lactamase class A
MPLTHGLGCVYHYFEYGLDMISGVARMKPRLGLTLVVAAAMFASAGVPLLAALPASATGSTTASSFCRSTSHPVLAAKLARDIQAALTGRVSTVALQVDDPRNGLGCWFHNSKQFDSASVVKVTILGALLRLALDQNRYLTSTEAAEARAMITMSDNAAASALWAELGKTHLQHFLDLAGMKQTVLGPDGLWGLTQITAHDQILLLRLLLNKNSVLDTASRNYALGLMAQVIPSQRWGVPAGAPTSFTVHVKNGWLPRATHGWRIHSIGCFTSKSGNYSIVVLTQDNPTMAYGITTIERVARVIHRDLNPGTTSVIPPSEVSASWGTSDERIPALPSIP